jgi:8-oxo-dGTP pyrophosphatase MutT (NUDIX family)
MIASLAPKVFETIGRPVIQRYWRWRRGLTLGVRGIVIDGDGRVLLVRHTYSPGWILPGGGVEFRETLEDSLARELEEEAGVALDEPAELMGIYDNREVFPGDHVAIYVVRSWHRTRVPKANIEIAETGFFHPDALPAPTNAGAKRRIEEFLGRQPRVSNW